MNQALKLNEKSFEVFWYTAFQWQWRVYSLPPNPDAKFVGSQTMQIIRAQAVSTLEVDMQGY